MNVTPEPTRPDPFVPERRERQPRGWKKKYLWAEDEKRRLTDERDELLELNRFFKGDNGELRDLIAWHTSGRAFAELATENSTLRGELEHLRAAIDKHNGADDLTSYLDEQMKDPEFAAKFKRLEAAVSSRVQAVVDEHAARDRRTASIAKHPSTRWPK